MHLSAPLTYIVADDIPPRTGFTNATASRTITSDALTRDVRAPLIIEVRANEHYADRRNTPNLPLTPEEIITDALECEAAGATIYHWHAREPDGTPSNDRELYLQVYRGLRDAGSKLITYPTLGFFTQTSVAERLAHVVPPADDQHLRPDVIPIDMGSVNVDLWDVDRRKFRTTETVYRNTTQHLLDMFAAIEDYGVRASLGIWDPGQVRTARLLQETGVIAKTVLWELIFAADVMPQAAFPTLIGLQAMVEGIPESQPWLVMCVHAEVMDLAVWAITLGGHVAIGLGDTPYARLGAPRNADLIRELLVIATALGRPVASPAEARRILALPDVSAVETKSTDT